jgi:hypothetical protein
MKITKEIIKYPNGLIGELYTEPNVGYFYINNTSRLYFNSKEKCSEALLDFLNLKASYGKLKELVKGNGETSSSLELNPRSIIAAGKAIKSAVYFLIIMLVFVFIIVMIASSSEDIKTIIGLYKFLGGISLIFNILILINLYSAGDNLENCWNAK